MIAVVGFREAPRAKFLQPALTCFRTSLHDLGVELAEILLSGMPAYSHFYPDTNRQATWPLELVPGESDAFYLPSAK